MYPPVTASVNSELEKGNEQSGNRKRGKYTKITQEEKARVARYATRAIRLYKDLNLKEASVRDWKLYEK